MALGKYYVVSTGYTFTAVYPYEQLYYKPVYKRTYYITSDTIAHALIKARYNRISKEIIKDLDFDYYVKKVKPNHYKYTTKRIAKRRCK